jgi:4-hydroxy-4-methyl-2-oxoglutarate aldolase
LTASDLNLSERLEKLFTTVVCDILDDYYDGVSSNKYLMEIQVKPVFPNMKVSGIAKTFSGASSAAAAAAFGGGEGGIGQPAPPQAVPTGDAALESIGPGEVVVYGTNHCRNAACWGELMTTAAMARGGRGLVTDGLARDLNRIESMRPVFPVFAAGATPTSGKGRFGIREFDVPVWCGGVPVQPGDFILGDLDGVIVIPRAIAPDVIGKSEERLTTEDKVRDAFQKRKPVAEIMKKYQVG